jgi:hypothetical protein
MRQFFDNEALQNLWDDLGYTHARLLYDKDAADLAPPLGALIERIEEAWKEQRKVWRAETIAQASVDAINFRMDERTLDFAFALEGANRKHPQGEQRQKRYFPIAPSKVVALSLESQMPYTESFANSLPKESEPELQAFASVFLQDVTEGRAAIEARQKAADERRDNRVRSIAVLVEEINNTRESVLAELIKRRAPRRKGKEWPESFFRKQKKNTPEERERELAQQTILGVFSCRGLEASTEVRKKIYKESDREILLKWLTKATTAASAEEAIS